jgi:hypothetical protein
LCSSTIITLMSPLSALLWARNVVVSTGRDPLGRYGRIVAVRIVVLYFLHRFCASVC